MAGVLRPNILALVPASPSAVAHVFFSSCIFLEMVFPASWGGGLAVQKKSLYEGGLCWDHPQTDCTGGTFRKSREMSPGGCQTTTHCLS